MPNGRRKYIGWVSHLCTQGQLECPEKSSWLIDTSQLRIVVRTKMMSDDYKDLYSAKTINNIQKHFTLSTVISTGSHFTSGTTCGWARSGEFSSVVEGRRTAAPQQWEDSPVHRYPLEWSCHSHGLLNRSNDSIRRHWHSWQRKKQNNSETKSDI